MILNKLPLPLLQIGMPVFNGERFIEEAINSLIAQSFTDWELQIADNASTDSTEEICRMFAGADKRIKYVRHAQNIGPAANFKYVLDHAAAPYFMWAASDDVWGEEFIENGIARLRSDADLGMAFSALEVIDSFGQRVRECPEIPEFSGAANFATIARYVRSPEFHGKANLIYSIYRTNVCKQAYARFPFVNVWGGDMCFNLAAMTIAGVDVVKDVHFFKRDPRSTDKLGEPVSIVVPERLVDRSCPLSMFPEYTAGLLRAVRGTRFYPLVYALMWFRRRQLQKES